MAETRLYIRVYFKALWYDAWQLEPTWQAVTAQLVAMPNISTAQIILRFGAGRWEDGTWITDGSNMDSRLFGYVQIRAFDGQEEYVWWTGVIPSESLAIIGQRTSTQTIDQTVTAYGLEYLLQSRITGSRIWRADTESGALAPSIDPAIVFNRRHDRGQTILGNRSSEKKKVIAADAAKNIAAEESYVFSADGAHWSNLDILEYLTETQTDTNGPLWSVYTGNAAIAECLTSTIEVWDFEGQTVLSAIAALIAPSRGLSWHIALIAGQPVIVPYSLLETAISAGNYTIPANDVQQVFDPFTDPTMTVTIERDAANIYDKIVVRGERIKSCFTVRMSEGTLEKAWTATEEAAYLAAAGSDPAANDLFRSTDRFERVFTSFRIPSSWNWKIGEAYAGIKLDSDGEVIADTAGEYFNCDKRLLTQLPFKAGWDYSGSSAASNNPAASEEEFRPVMAWFAQDSKKVLADKIPSNGAHVRPLQREFGIEAAFNPRHLAALNHWSGAAVSNQEPAATAVDYTTLCVTAMAETDVFCQVSSQIEDYATAEGRRTLVIDVPDAELWYITPGTVVDIDNAGAEIVYGGSSNFVRDDRERLRAILASAKAWYQVRRAKIALRKEGLAYPYYVGSMLKVDPIGTDPEGCSSVVTAVMWDFLAQTTLVQTGFAEHDFRAMFSGIRGTPTLKSAAKKIDLLARQVSAIKSEQGKSPVRIGMGGVSEGGTQLTYYYNLNAPDMVTLNQAYKLYAAEDEDYDDARATAYTVGTVVLCQDESDVWKRVSCIVENIPAEDSAVTWPFLGSGWESYWEAADIEGYIFAPPYSGNIEEYAPLLDIDEPVLTIEDELEDKIWIVAPGFIHIATTSAGEIVQKSLWWNTTDKRLMSTFGG